MHKTWSKFVELFGLARAALICNTKSNQLGSLCQFTAPKYFYPLVYGEYIENSTELGKWRIKIVLEFNLYDEWATNFFEDEYKKLDESEDQTYFLVEKRMFLNVLLDYWMYYNESFWHSEKIIRKRMSTIGQTIKGKAVQIKEIDDKEIIDKNDPNLMLWWENGPLDTSLYRALTICIKEAVSEHDKKFYAAARRRHGNINELDDTIIETFVICVGKKLKKQSPKGEIVSKLHFDKMSQLVEEEEEFKKIVTRNKNLLKDFMDNARVKKFVKLLEKKDEYLSVSEGLTDSSDTDEETFKEANVEFEENENSEKHLPKYSEPQLLMSGSQLIGAYIDGSDLDLLCVVPDTFDFYHFYEENEDSLKSFLKKKLHGIISLNWIPGKVKILRIELQNIEIDLLPVFVPEKFLLKKDLKLEDDELIQLLTNESSIYALAGYRSGKYQMSLVPSRKEFTALLKAVKIWAKNRLIYAGIFGYFNGATLSVMTAKICTLFPHAPLSYLLYQFFSIYSKWNWSQGAPVMLAPVTPITLNQFVRTWPPIFGTLPINDLRNLAGAKWAVITGASDGIGKAYAQELSNKGFNIILIARSAEKLRMVADEIQSTKLSPDSVKWIVFDFKNANFEAYERFIFSELDELDIGILVNNVGSVSNISRLDNYPGGLQIIADELAINIMSHTILTAYVIKQMLTRKHGLIINIASMAAYHPMRKMPIYSSAKKYLTWFSEILRKDYAGTGVVVQTICPGRVDTKMAQNVLHQSDTGFFSPLPKQFVQQALRTVGHSTETTGCIGHQIQAELSSLLPTFLTDIYVKNEIKKAERRAMASQT
uniref:Polynucleotide adenylyltransferase n=1 Tax=Globodera rostochiensis TaxID=31243 RepID=A0A914H7Y6_GLORO